jgi:hypothetical protein
LPSRRPLVAQQLGDQWLPGGQPRPVAGDNQQSPAGRELPPLYTRRGIFFIKKFGTSFFLLFKGPCMLQGPRLLWGVCAQHPHFLKLAPHLEVLNLPSFMDFGDFIFFQTLFFLNLEYTWTFISTFGIFVS